MDSAKLICEKQGVPRLFLKLLIKHYARSDSFLSVKNRFDECVSHYLSLFNTVAFIEIMDAINNNRQIYGYGWQRERNDKILKYALPLLPEGSDLSRYEHFKYTVLEQNDGGKDAVDEAPQEGAEVTVSDNELPV